MSKTLRICLTWGLLLGGNFPATARQASKMEGKPDLKITLRVYDYVGVDAGLLRRALHEAGIIVGDAGVAVVPILCTEGKAPGGTEPSQSQDESPKACRQVPDPLNIALRIVPKPVPGNDYGTLGYASSRYITVNYSRVKEFADRADVYLDRILACVLAHELGHVLLGPDSHSATGIMAACLTDKELGQIRVMFIGFLPFQKAAIQAYVLAQTRELGAGSRALVQR